jgi:branched-chain amino acid transport system substrate-binding protein
MCGTEAFVEPGMANFLYGKPNVRSAYILDDVGAGGVGIADAVQAAAEKKCINVVGRDTIDLKAKALQRCGAG